MAKAKETKPEKKPESPEEKKKTITAFILMFPSMIAGFIGIASAQKPFWINITIMGALILQYVLLEQFVKDYYKIRA